MKQAAIFLCLLVAFFAQAQAGDAAGSTITGTILDFTLDSSVLGEQRGVFVALPADYDESSDRYPVLYVLDADWHMLPAVAATRMLAETSYIRSHRIPGIIVVGIANVDRNRDNTPTRRESQHGMYFPTSGGADAFLGFMEEELIPEIDRRFRTHPHRILAGWSLGGLFTMYTLFERPGTFDGYIAISPSLWWDGGLLVQRGTELAASGASRDRDLVLTIGTGEEGGLCYNAVHDLVARWKDAPVADLRVTFLEIAGEDHNHSPYKAYFDGLRAIFADWFFPEEAFAGGLETLEAHYASLSQRYGYNVVVPDHVYGALVRSLLSEERFDDAVRVVGVQCERNPDSAELQLQLGYVLAQAHNRSGARDAYRKAIEIEHKRSEPDSVFVDYVQRMISELDAHD